MSTLPALKLPQVGRVNATLETDVLVAVVAVAGLILYARKVPQGVWNAALSHGSGGPVGYTPYEPSPVISDPSRGIGVPPAPVGSPTTPFPPGSAGNPQPPAPGSPGIIPQPPYVAPSGVYDQLTLPAGFVGDPFSGVVSIPFDIFRKISDPRRCIVLPDGETRGLCNG